MPEIDLFWGILSVSAFAFFFAGCACCGLSCTFFSDAFTRADSTNIGSDWTEVSGDWSIASNTLSIVATTSAKALCNTSTVALAHHVAVTIRFTNTSDLARVLLDYVNSTNFMYAEFKCGTVGSGHVRVGIVSAGVDTALATSVATFNTATNYAVTACVGQYGIKAVGNSITAKALRWHSQTGEFALATGGTCAGTITFDTLTASILRPDCQACDVTAGCGGCVDTIPQEYQVDVALVADAHCTTCDLLNGTWFCGPPPPPSLAVACRYIYTPTVCECDTSETGNDSIQVDIGLTTSIIFAFTNDAGLAFRYEYRHTFSGGPTIQCCFENQSMTAFDLDNLSGPPVQGCIDRYAAADMEVCDFTSATVVLSATVGCY
jgi:hypothetical protein